MVNNSLIYTLDLAVPCEGENKAGRDLGYRKSIIILFIIIIDK